MIHEKREILLEISDKGSCVLGELIKYPSEAPMYLSAADYLVDKGFIELKEDLYTYQFTEKAMKLILTKAVGSV